jgi:hypothetical protein
VTPSIRQCRSLSKCKIYVPVSLSIARSFLCKIQLSRVSIPEANSPTKLAPSFKQCNFSASRPGAATSAGRLSILTRLSIRLLIDYQTVISFGPGYQSGR